MKGFESCNEDEATHVMFTENKFNLDFVTLGKRYKLQTDRYGQKFIRGRDRSRYYDVELSHKHQYLKSKNNDT